MLFKRIFYFEAVSSKKEANLGTTSLKILSLFVILGRPSALGLQNVEFRGLVPKREVFKVLSEADAQVYSFRKLPLLKYGVSPVKIFDYLASGRPILYAVEGTNNPVAEAGSGITIPPENPAALAEQPANDVAADVTRAPGHQHRFHSPSVAGHDNNSARNRR